MSLIKNNLTRIADFGSKGLYAYHSDDLKNAIEGANYFGGVAHIVEKGDVIQCSYDLDGTPGLASYVVSSNDGTTVVLTENDSVTQNVLQVLTVRVPVLGTASTHYIICPVAGAITGVDGVGNANGAVGTGTITVSVPTTGAIATLPFPSGYTAGAKISDTSITAHTLAAGAVITVATDGTGDGTGETYVTLTVTPS